MLAGDAGPGFRRAPQVTQSEALALAHIAAPDARLWNRQPLVSSHKIGTWLPEDVGLGMIRKSGNRFSEKIMLKPELMR
jgi:hypothetical protein